MVATFKQAAAADAWIQCSLGVGSFKLHRNKRNLRDQGTACSKERFNSSGTEDLRFVWTLKDKELHEMKEDFVSAVLDAVHSSIVRSNSGC
eukprot:1145307-Pelagomonas_calceolata.AAC.5